MALTVTTTRCDRIRAAVYLMAEFNGGFQKQYTVSIKLASGPPADIQEGGRTVQARSWKFPDSSIRTRPVTGTFFSQKRFNRYVSHVTCSDTRTHVHIRVLTPAT